MSIKGANLIQVSKSTAQLQVEKANLINGLDQLRREVNDLSVRKNQLEMDISREQNLYDTMVLKTTAEMQADLEDRIEEAKKVLQDLMGELENVKIELASKNSLLNETKGELAKLKQEIDKANAEFQRNLEESKKILASVHKELESAQGRLSKIVKNIEKEKANEIAAKKNTEMYIQQQADYAKSLERKNRDLKIWQKRLDPLFKQKFPNGEMKFV